MRPYIISLLAVCISVISLAAAISRNSTAANEPTRIEADQQANIIRFVIDGAETMRLDAKGLHIRDDLEFGGQVVDVGRIGYPKDSAEPVNAE